MENSKSPRKVLMIIYIFGVICVCALLLRMVIGGNTIMNQNAMIPTTYAESSTFILAVGSFPMCLVSFLLYVYTEKSKLRVLLFIPAAVTLASLIYCVVAVLAAVL